MNSGLTINFIKLNNNLFPSEEVLQRLMWDGSNDRSVRVVGMQIKKATGLELGREKGTLLNSSK